MGVLLALLLVVLVFHSYLLEDPQQTARLLLFYLVVLAPAGIAGGLYGVYMHRQDLLQVHWDGIAINTPAGQDEIAWTDVACVRIFEGKGGQTDFLRLYLLEGRPVTLYPYLPLATVREAVEKFRPACIPLEIVRRRINWSSPQTQNLVFGSVVAVLALLLWYSTLS